MTKRIVLSQGEVRPGVVQGQYWREEHPRCFSTYALGRDGGEGIPVSVLGGYQPEPTYGFTVREVSDAFTRLLGAGVRLR